jgi:hypothetical protein
MGLFGKMFQDVPLSQMLQNDNYFHSGTCDECGATFLFPEYPIAYWPYPKKPKGELDVGGWCIACRRMLCQAHADWVGLEVERQTWMVPGCASCQEPMAGRANRDAILGSS